MKIEGLKKIRQSKNISQLVMADKLDISRAQYIKIEQSENVPDKYIPDLLDILGYNSTLSVPFDGTYLQTLRFACGISQKQLAAYMGVSQQSIMQKESSKQKFSYQREKEKYFKYLKNTFPDNKILPFIEKEVPGATVFFSLDKCYILINDEQLFRLEDYIIDPEISIIIYKIVK